MAKKTNWKKMVEDQQKLIDSRKERAIGKSFERLMRSKIKEKKKKSRSKSAMNSTYSSPNRRTICRESEKRMILRILTRFREPITHSEAVWTRGEGGQMPPALTYRH